MCTHFIAMEHANNELVTLTEAIQEYCHGGIGEVEFYPSTKASTLFTKIAAELGTAKVGADNRGHAAIPRKRLAEVFTEKTLPDLKYAVLQHLQTSILSKACTKAELTAQLNKVEAEIGTAVQTAAMLKTDLEMAGFKPKERPKMSNSMLYATLNAGNEEDDE